MMKYWLILSFGVIAVSSAAIFIRLAEAPPLVIAMFRMCLASMIIAPIALINSRQEILKLNRPNVLLLVLSGILLATHFGLWIASLDYTSVTSSVVLVTSSPVFVAIISYWLLKERLNRLSIFGMGVCLIGALILGYSNWNTGSLPLLGAVLAFLGAITVSGYVLIGRILRQKIGLISYIFLTYSTAGLLLLIIVMALRYPLAGYSGNTYVMLILLAIIPQLIGHSALNWSLRFLTATVITIGVLGEPIIATILAYFILHESPHLFEIVGGLVILMGIYLALMKTRVKENNKPL
jgi:drug/metabolite transporter (DMT)-like permease